MRVVDLLNSGADIETVGGEQHHTLSELVQQCLIVPDNIASVYMHTCKLSD